MENKITEKILEPGKIYVGSNFLLKIKAIPYLVYEDFKGKTYNQPKNYTYKELKGE